MNTKFAAIAIIFSFYFAKIELILYFINVHANWNIKNWAEQVNVMFSVDVAKRTHWY
jgi:D-alanyl-lipoteichoic acid acyltransferase DltB (MBOAT superfamily)